MGCFRRANSPTIFYWVPFGETMTGGDAFEAGFLFLKDSTPESDDPREFLDERMGGEQKHGVTLRDDNTRPYPPTPTYMGGTCPCPSIDNMDFCTSCGFKWSPSEDKHGTPISGENMPPDSPWSDLDFTTSFDDPFDFMWDMAIAKDFFHGTPTKDDGRRMMQGVMGGDTLGHFVPVGTREDLRTKEGRAENYSRTEMPRWRYGEDGEPERYMEQLPKREVLPHREKGYYGVDLSSPAWWMQYGTYGQGLSESNRLEEGVEQTLHHEAMHSAVNDELMSHYQAGVDQKALDDFGLMDDDKPNPEQREVLQGYIDDNFYRAHEYAAHLGQETGLNNPNKIFGRRREGPTNRNSHRHEDAWGDYSNHPGSNLSPESMAMGDEIHTARMTGIPFPPKLSDFSDDMAYAGKRDEAYGGGYKVRDGEEGNRWHEDKWADYIDPDDYYPDWDTIPVKPGSEEASFRDYRQLSPKYNQYQGARDNIQHLGHHLDDQRFIGSVNEQGGVVPDSRRAMGVRAVANAAKLMGKDFDISQFMEDRGL